MFSLVMSSLCERSLRNFRFRSRLYISSHQSRVLACNDRPLSKKFSSTTEPSSLPHFDGKLATILAAYSFEAYNDSFIGKPALGLDHTKVYFSSLQHIRNLFDGAVIVTIKNVKLMKSHEKQLAERLVSGSDPDPYVISSVYERYSDNPMQNRLLDSARSSTKRNTLVAEWFGRGELTGRDGESFALYLRDTNTTTLEFSVFDEEVFSVDEFLGNAVLSFQELKNIMQQREKSTGLPEMNYSEDYELLLPVYVDQYCDKTKESLLQSLKAFATSKPNKVRVQVGTLTVSVKYLPWNILSNEQISNLVVLGDTNVIESTSTTNILNNNIIMDTWEQLRKKKPSDWSQFLTKAIKRQLPSLPMPSDMLNPTEGNLLNHTSLALQQLQQKMAARNANAEINNGSLENSVFQETIMALDDKSLKFQTAFLPRGAIPNVADWAVLLQHLLQEQTNNTLDGGKDNIRVQKLMKSLSNGQMHQIGLIDNPDTDTQVAIWADSSTKTLIVSFRGTELVRIKDILTDINMLQAPFRPDHPELSRVKVHLGFLKAYDSVQLTLLQQLHDIATRHWQTPANTTDTSTMNNDDKWSIYVTGHSLGGALATLFAFDLARIRAGMYNLSSTDDNESNSNWYSQSISKYFPWGNEEQDEFKAIPLQKQRKSNVLRSPRDMHYANSLVRPEADAAPIFLTTPTSSNSLQEDKEKVPSVLLSGLQSCDLTIYTYGCPRVGDTSFKQLFDRLVPHCFRVVNGQDIIARMPRNVTLPFVVDNSEDRDTYNTSNVPWKKKAEKKKQMLKMKKDTASSSTVVDGVTELNFAHVGRTVLIDPSYVPPNSTVSSTANGVWIEQESISFCPLSQDGSLFLPTSVFASIASKNVTFFSSSSKSNKLTSKAKSIKVPTLSLSEQVRKVTTEKVNQLVSEMELQIKPAVALAVENATNNVTEMVDKHLKQQYQYLSPETVEYEKLKVNLKAAEITWAKVTEDLVKRLRSNSPAAATVTEKTKASNASDADITLTKQWQLFEQTLTEWKTAVSSSSTAQPSLDNKSNSNVLVSQQQERWQQVLSLASSLGVDTTYLEREMALLSSIWERTAIEHHLEPSYYLAMCRVSGCDEVATIAENIDMKTISNANNPM